MRWSSVNSSSCLRLDPLRSIISFLLELKQTVTGTYSSLFCLMAWEIFNWNFWHIFSIIGLALNDCIFPMSWSYSSICVSKDWLLSSLLRRRGLKRLLDESSSDWFGCRLIWPFLVVRDGWVMAESVVLNIRSVERELRELEREDGGFLRENSCDAIKSLMSYNINLHEIYFIHYLKLSLCCRCSLARTSFIFWVLTAFFLSSRICCL